MVNSTRVLVTGITSFSFSAYNISGTLVPTSTAAERTAANGTTKQLQISLEAARSNTTVVAATNTVLSAVLFCATSASPPEPSVLLPIP